MCRLINEELFNVWLMLIVLIGLIIMLIIALMTRKMRGGRPGPFTGKKQLCYSYVISRLFNLSNKKLNDIFFFILADILNNIGPILIK